MEHEYSRFKNKTIPYAKVGRRVFSSLFDAETYCTKNGLNVDIDIEYREDNKLKAEIQEIAKYQKAILREVLDRFEEWQITVTKQFEWDKAKLMTCRPLDRSYLEEKLQKEITENLAVYNAISIVQSILLDLERVTNWDD